MTAKTCTSVSSSSEKCSLAWLAQSRMGVSLPVFDVRTFPLAVIVAGLNATSGALAQAPALQHSAPEHHPKISCNAEQLGMVCRAESAQFVWCRSQEELGNLQSSVSREPARHEAIVAEATTRGSCGTTLGTVMNQYGFPVGTLEHPRGPEPAVSRVLFAAVSNGNSASPVQTIPTADPKVSAPSCTIGQLCTFAAPIFACSYADAEKIGAGGPTQATEIGMGLVGAQSCQVVPAGRPLKTEATLSAKVVYLTEAGQHLGYTPVGIFATVEPSAPPEPERQVPLRITSRTQDIMLYRRGPAPVVAQMSGQGTAKAVGLFRSGMSERRDYCANSAGDGRAAMQRCLATYQNDEAFSVHADCEKRVVTVLDQTFRLHQRPTTFPADGNVDEKRKWLWQDVATDEWLDGTTPSHEQQADSAFDALCPGRRPDADHGLVLRDPAAQYPLPLRGTWAQDATVCEQTRRAQPERVEGVLTIRARDVLGYEYREELNQLRRTDAQGWTADVSWSGEGDSGQASVAYTLQTGTLFVTGSSGTRHLVLCQR